MNSGARLTDHAAFRARSRVPRWELIEALPQQPVETLRRQELRAPIAGRVAERRVELGSLVGREGQESELYVIVDLSVVWADLSVPTSDLATIEEGQQIT